MALVVKNLQANAGDLRDKGSIPESGRSPGEGHDNSLQYPCLENPMDRGAWWATFQGVTEGRTWLKWLSTQAFQLGSHRQLKQNSFPRWNNTIMGGVWVENVPGAVFSFSATVYKSHILSWRTVSVAWGGTEVGSWIIPWGFLLEVSYHSTPHAHLHHSELEQEAWCLHQWTVMSA